jgi:L-fuculose-phosphate aldolase
MHLKAYERSDVQAVVHTHSLYATSLSLLRDDVPPVHYQIGEMGGEVLVAEYATYGTDQLAANMVKALADRGACILRNHGTVTVGTSLAHAYHRARQLEWLCQVWLTARSVGSPTLLDADEVAVAAKKLSGYGQGGR